MKDIINFTDTYDLAEDLIQLSYESLETSVIGSFEFISELLKSVLVLDTENDFKIKDVTITNPYLDGYSDKYLLEIDDTQHIWIYKILTDENEYLISGTDILFIEPDVDSKVYSNIEYDSLIVCAMDEECDGDCEHCHLHEEKDTTEVSKNGNVETHESPSSITQSWSSPDGNAYFSRSFYSSIEDEMEKVKVEWRKFAQMF